MSSISSGRSVPKSVQRGTATVNTASSPGYTDVTISSVDTTKARLKLLGFNGGAANSSANYNATFPYVTVLNATTVRVVANYGSAGAAGMVCAFEVEDP